MRHGSLCTGIGGLDRAAEAVYGGEMAWYSELEPAACLVIDRNWSAPNLGDLTAIDWSTVEPVDVLTAGYPCQPFSHAGNRQGEDDERHLWPYIADAVRVLRPRRVVLENVAGHLSLGFDVVLGDLAEAGFDAEWCVLRASDVGAPHQRARLFVVAADATDLGHEWGGPAWRRGHGPSDGDQAPANTTSAERRGTQQQGLASAAGRTTEPRERYCPGAERGVATDWGQYAPAIRRWERTLGRPSPAPTDDAGRLSPSVVEWMMGYPAGWVDGLSRTQALKALGNAVVPQQGEAAIRLLEAEYVA